MTTTELEPIERASRDELAALQLVRLRLALRRAYEKVAFYRAAFDRAGAHPDDLRELADLARFPFLEKAFPRELSLRAPRRAARGDGALARVERHDRQANRRRLYTARYRYLGNADGAFDPRGGRTPRYIVHVSYGYGLFTGGLGAHYGAERLGCTVIPMSGGQTEKQVQLIADLRPRIIMVTPSYVLAIAEEMVRQGLDPATCSLEIGIFGAEPWTNEMRAQIEALLGIDAVDIYGLSEIMGPGVAVECLETKDGLTLWEDHFYPEIIDPQTGDVLPEGSFGELVLTTLTKEALPAIRYRTRDLTRLLPGSARSMRRLQRITGRSDDMLIIRGVNVFPSQIEELIVRDDRLTPHYQLHLTRSGALDEVLLRVEVHPGVAQDQFGQCAGALAATIKSYAGVTMHVDVVAPGTIPRSQGKAVRVIDQRAG